MSDNANILARLRLPDPDLADEECRYIADRIETLIAERDEALAQRDAAKHKMLADIPEHAKVAAARNAAEAEVARLRVAVQRAQRPEGEAIAGVVLWIKEDADRLAAVRAALATEDTP